MITKKHLIKIETADDHLFSFISSLLRKVQKKHPDYLEVVEVDKSHQTILFISSSYIGANVSHVVMQQQLFWRDQNEGALKVERLPYKVDG